MDIAFLSAKASEGLGNKPAPHVWSHESEVPRIRTVQRIARERRPMLTLIIFIVINLDDLCEVP